MATNFEFHKNRLKAGFKREYVSKCLTEAIEEAIEVKIHKRCGDLCAECVLNTIEWLLAEHIEQPKLTKRERAFCGAVQTGWIARDCNMHLFYFSGKPELKQGTWMTHVGQHCRIKGIEDAFMFIKDTDAEPWSIEDLLKLEVQE